MVCFIVQQKRKENDTARETGKETAQQRRKGETDFTERMKYGNQFMMTTLNMRGAMEAGKREMVETWISVLLGAKERLSDRRSGALIIITDIEINHCLGHNLLSACDTHV